MSAPSLPPTPANMAAAAPPDPRLLLAVLLLLPPPGPLCAAGPELSRRFTERKRCADPECSSECRAVRCGRRGALLFLRAGQKNAFGGGRCLWEGSAVRAVRVRSPTGCVPMLSSGGGAVRSLSLRGAEGWRGDGAEPLRVGRWLSSSFAASFRAHQLLFFCALRVFFALWIT